MPELRPCPSCGRVVAITRKAVPPTTDDVFGAAIFGWVYALLLVVSRKRRGVCSECGAEFDAGPPPLERFLGAIAIVALVAGVVALGVYCVGMSQLWVATFAVAAAACCLIVILIDVRINRRKLNRVLREQQSTTFRASHGAGQSSDAATRRTDLPRSIGHPD